MTSPDSIRGGHILPVFLIVLAGFLPYSNVLHASFVFDDIPNIVKNPTIRSLSNFLPFGIGWRQFPTRFIGYLSFGLNYWMDGVRVYGYHLVNIFLHIGNAILVYALSYLSQKTPAFRLRKESPPSICLPILSALLFAVHPVQTQAVSYVVQRFASLAALFYIGSIVTYLKGRIAMTGFPEKKGGRSIPWIIISLSCALLAMKTKEIAFTLPVVVTLFEGMFFTGKWRKRLALVLPYFFAALVIPYSMINVEQPLGMILSDVSEKTYLQTDLPRATYLITQFRVIMTYLRLLIFPVNQNLDYDYPVFENFFEPQILLSLFLILFLIGASILLSGKSLEEGNGKMRLAAFGIFWFFLALSVESSVVPIVDVIFEHRVYLPSVGAFVAVSSFASWGYGHINWNRKRYMAVFLSATIILTLTAGTYARNRIWQNNLVLWEDVARKSPRKARPHYNLGVAYDNAGKIREAIEQYRKAVEIRWEYHEAQNNLGVLYARTGWIDNAIQHFEKAVELDPKDAGYRINLAQAYAIKGLPEKAKEQKAQADRLLSSSK